MSIATLADVKRKLEVPAADTTLDDALTPVLSAASDRVLELTRYVEAEDAGRIETFLNATLGDVVTLERRPVSAVTVAGRELGAEFFDLEADVVDADEGKVALMPVTSGWPFYRAEGDEITYPVVRVTYTADALAPVPARLADACAGLAAYWYRQHVAGPVTAAQVGPIRQTLSTAPAPEWLADVLAEFMEAGDNAAGGATVA